jgi:hypothetical protein
MIATVARPQATRRRTCGPAGAAFPGSLLEECPAPREAG